MRSTGFNPRARAGRDDTMIVALIGFVGFNPRARAGRDNRGKGAVFSVVLFQPTRPRGARPDG